MNASELAAAEIVAAYVAGQSEARDVEGAPDATHDFDVVMEDGQRVALEVTTAADDALLSLDAAAFGRDWTAPELVNDWWLVLSRRIVRPPITFHRLMREIVPLLEVMEQHEVSEVSRECLRTPREEIPSELVEARERLIALGGDLARSNGPRQSLTAGQVFLSLTNGFAASVSQVNSLVAAAAESNRAKLVSADADERDLFVWLNPSQSSAELAVSIGHPLGPPPDVPAGIDVIWLGTQGVPGFGAVPFAGVGVLRLWRVRPPSEWQSMPLRVLAKASAGTGVATPFGLGIPPHPRTLR